jgi:uncharacterized membrane protein
MQDVHQTSELTPSGRIAAVDVARGLALVGMGAYHLTWDLAHFGFVEPSVPFSPAMRLLSHTVAGSFLALVGVSFALAHPSGLRRVAFLRRLAIVAAAALLVTVATEFLAPDEPITFGILHCIAAASLLAAPFVGAPAWASLAAGALALATPLIVTSARLDAPALIWLGLGTIVPPTLDWRPLFPWAGVVLVGLALARALPPRVFAASWARWRPRALVGRAFAFAGRHSLAIYLVHQPILFALLFGLASLTGAAARQERTSYLATCRPSCVENGGELALCAKACACVADRAQGAGISLGAARGQGDDEAGRRLKAIVAACSEQTQ